VSEPCWTRTFPRQIDVTKQFLQRGQNRYNIYCAACHGYDGEGKGMIQQRVASLGESWAVRDLVSATSNVISMPNGQLFGTISNGMNTMAGYAAQIPPVDRWAIVAYVRALQRARNALTSDIPPEELGRAKSPQIKQPEPPKTEPKQ
jgi:mono/diheme cytochrome c family protein